MESAQVFQLERVIITRLLESDGSLIEAVECHRRKHLIVQYPSLQRSKIGTGNPVEHKRSRHLLNKACEANIACKNYDKCPQTGKRDLLVHLGLWKEWDLLPRSDFPSHQNVPQDRRSQKNWQHACWVTSQQIREPESALVCKSGLNG